MNESHCVPSASRGTTRSGAPERTTELTHVGPGTPCGEYLRRYWQPIAMSEELGELPRVVRILGEDLVLFRDRSGRAGTPASTLRAPGRVAGVRDRGRAGHHLLLPRLALRHRRDHPPGWVRASRQSRSAATWCRGPIRSTSTTTCCSPISDRPRSVRRSPSSTASGCRMHLPQAVRHHHALQLAPGLREHPGPRPRAASACPLQRGPVRRGIGNRPGDRVPGHSPRHDERPDPAGRRAMSGSAPWTPSCPTATRRGPSGKRRRAPKAFQRCAILRWMVPLDDTATRTIGWRFFSPRLDPRGQDDPKLVGRESDRFRRPDRGRKRPYEERQRQPGDFEAQVSQRPIAIHALEHRASSDAGVARLRRLLRQRILALAAGEPVRQPDAFGLDAVPTYCQDTVFRWQGSEQARRERSSGGRAAGGGCGARLGPARPTAAGGLRTGGDGEFLRLTRVSRIFRMSSLQLPDLLDQGREHFPAVTDDSEPG